MRFPLPLTSALLMLALVGCAKDVVEPDTAPPEDTEPEDTTPEWEDADLDGFTEDVDCDDTNPEINPDATEVCDGVDNNCDEAVDEGFDADEDGHYSAEDCETGDDCDDSDASVYPDADEVPYDGMDQDCDGSDLTDVDGDGFDADVAGGEDCDDGDAGVNPLAEDVAYDGVDQDCDGSDNLDADGDGYDSADHGGADCDDSDADVNPGASDYLVDEVDADCDGKDGARFDLDDAEVIVEANAGAPTAELLGRGVSICDIDADGQNDLVVGAPYAASYSGQVAVFYGSGASTWTSGMTIADADTVISGGTRGFIGYFPDCIDFNGDGFQDLIFQRGEINYLGTYVQQFGLLVFYGDGNQMGSSIDAFDSDTELTLELGVPTDQDSVSSVTMSTGDLDGDAAADVILAAGAYNQTVFDYEERVLILPGGEYSGALSMADQLSHIIVPDQATQLSWAGATSDLDADGNTDLVVLSNLYTSDLNDTGDSGDTAYELEGAMNFVGVLTHGHTTSTTSLEELDGTQFTGRPTTQFGWRLVEGDFDGDGIQDLIVSNRGTNNSGESLSGGAYFFSNAGADMLGGALEVEAEADSWTDGPRGGGLFGDVLVNAGDIDGDGMDDLLISQPDIVTGYLGRGDIYLVPGSTVSSIGYSDWTEGAIMHWRGNSSEDWTGLSMAADDFDGDGIADLVVTEPGYSGGLGRVYISLSSGW